jgi:hypothetical protein
MLVLTHLMRDPVPLFRLLLWLASQPLVWAGLGIAVGPYWFYRGFRLLQRKRLILDIPRSTIRGAAVGAVEISGKAVGPYTLVSPLALRDCLYYRLMVRVSEKNERRMLMDEACAPLFVDDGTGEQMIYPAGAEMQLSSMAGDGGGYLDQVLSRHGFSREDLLTAEEYSIAPGEEIFVLGTLCENRWTTKRADASRLSRIGPGFVSFDEADLLRREAFPGLDPTLPSGAAQGREFNLYPSTILMQGRNPFVISTRSQGELVSQLAWKSFLYIWGAPVWTLWGLWRILTQLEIWRGLAGNRN